MLIYVLLACNISVIGIAFSIWLKQKSTQANVVELNQKIANFRESNSELNSALKDSLSLNNNLLISSITQQLQTISSIQKDQLVLFSNQVNELNKMSEIKLENIRKTLENSILNLQNENNKKLESIRSTVEEKLHETLEKRLSDSFRLVSERLEVVHKGLGEMQTLAIGVGDLKKVLNNIKVRGTWGEVQLEMLIEQMLSPEQYEKNAQVTKGSRERVEFAVKMPGKDDRNHSVLLPIDSKFPIEDFQRLIEAEEAGNIELIEISKRQLEASIKSSAKTISDKYINPPHTTDFAIMFLPIEALYAEVLRKPGIVEILQREYRVIITSPTTLSAILNSLQLGFKTLAIEKRSSEVWKLLSTVKAEFVKFADLLTKTRTKLEQASQAIGDAEAKTRRIQSKLSGVETISDNDNADEEIIKVENLA